MVETKFQTSFIPKKPVSVDTSPRSGISLLTLIATIVFLIALGISGYVFLQKGSLVQKIAAEQANIQTNRSGLVADQITIESIIQLNNRINVANELLQKHTVVSPLFGFLSQVTLPTVRFRNMNFSTLGKDAAGAQRISVELVGQADSYQTVASQADELGKINWTNIIKEPKVSNVVSNSDGTVSFNVSFYVVPEYLNYAEQQARARQQQ